MGTGPLARVALVVLALAPALAWFATPTAPLLAVIVASVAIAAALHGLGRGVGALLGDPDAPVALAIAWGLAAYLAVGGALVAVGQFDQVGQRIVLVVGTAIGAAWCVPRLAALRPSRRVALAWLTPALASAAVAVHVIGAAGTWQGRFSDGEVFQLGPLARLAATGELGDAMAVPRASGLGGNLLVSALAAAFGDLRYVHAIDGLAMGLTLALAWLGLRGSMRLVVGFVLVALASMMPDYTDDLAPLWTIVALVLALHETLARADRAGRTPWAAILLAGAMVALRHASLGLALVVVVHAIISAPPGRSRWRIGLTAAATLGFAIGGLVIAAIAAWARASGPPVGPAPLLQVVGWGAGAAVVTALLALAIRGVGQRALSVTLVAVGGAAGTVGALSPGPMIIPFAVPLAIALVFLALAPALTSTAPAPRSLTAAVLLLVALVLATTRFPMGRSAISWGSRLGRLLDAGRELSTTGAPDETPTRARYAAALAVVPKGARVGLWVDRAALIDYRHHRVVDLRSVATAACVERSSEGARACAPLVAALPDLLLDYVIVAATALCVPATGDRCRDPITRLVEGARPVGGAAELSVFELRRPVD